MFKKKILAAIVATSFLAAPVAMAENAKKIGVLNVHQLMQEASKPKDIQKELQSEYQPKFEEVQILDKALRADMEKLQRDKDVMSASEKSKLEQKIQEQQQSLMAKQNQYGKESQEKQQKLMQSFMEEVKSEVESYGKKNGYDLIILSDAVPYMKDSFKITDEILKRVEKKG